MSANSSAILALILLVILCIVIAVALAYNPAPAVVVSQPEKTPKAILAEKNKAKKDCKSSMSPPTRSQLSPASDHSIVPTAWSVLDRIRSERSSQDAY